MLRSSHLKGLAQTEQQMFHTILKCKLKTIGSLSLIKMDWCGMQKTKSMRNHTENHGIEGMSGMSCGSLKSKQNKPMPWAKNRREYLPQMYAMYNVTPNHKQHLTLAINRFYSCSHQAYHCSKISAEYIGYIVHDNLTKKSRSTN